jgi:hypothetical protein
MRTSPALAVLMTLILSNSLVTNASAYTQRDVRYVTSSRDLDVIDFVICLEKEFGKIPRNVSRNDALDDAEAACDAAGYRLSSSPFEPDAVMLHDYLLDCGFRPIQARVGSTCGGRAALSVRRPSTRSCPPPQIFRAGRCRNPVAGGACPPPQVFRAGRCRNPIGAVTCPPPQVFRAGRCRNPVAGGACPPPKVFRAGRCRNPAAGTGCPPPKVFRAGRCR